MKYKKDILKQIKKIAPEFLVTKDVARMMEKLYFDGVVYREEKTFFETKLYGKIICLMVEKVFYDHDLEVDASLYLVDGKNDSGYSKLISLSAPYVPEEITKILDGRKIAPFDGSWSRAVLTNKIVVVKDINTSTLYNDNTLEIMQRYGVESEVCFPIHCDNGEVIGVLIISSHEKMKLETEFLLQIAEMIESMKYVFSVLQESWKDNVAIEFKGIMDRNGKIMYAEQNVESILGFKPNEINNILNYRFFVHPKDMKKVENELEILFKENKAARTIFRARTKLEGYKTIDILCVPVKNMDGSLRYYKFYVRTNSVACKEYDELTNKKMANY